MLKYRYRYLTICYIYILWLKGTVYEVHFPISGVVGLMLWLKGTAVKTITRTRKLVRKCEALL